jgi:hypothetical protein
MGPEGIRLEPVDQMVHFPDGFVATITSTRRQVGDTFHRRWRVSRVEHGADLHVFVESAPDVTAHVLASWGALIHFPDGRDRVLSLSQQPFFDKRLAGQLEGDWVIADAKASGGTVDGQEYTFEVWVKPAGE